MGQPHRSFATLLLATLPVIAAAAAEEAAPPAEPDFRFDQGSSTPPLPIRLASNKVHLEVAWGDAEPEWFLLDSGANMTILNREFAERLGLELRGETTGYQAAGGRPFRVAFANGPAYRVPGLEISGHPVAVLDRQTEAANGHPSSGLIGADNFRRLVVDIDYPARTLRFHDPATFTYDGPGIAVPAEIDDNLKWLVGAEIKPYGRQPLAARFSVDTGGRGLLTLNAPFVEENRLVESLPVALFATVGVGVGGEVRHHLGRLEELRLGALRVADPPVSLAPVGTEGAYGRADKSGVVDAELLTRFRVIFDTAAERIIFEPRPGFEAPFEHDMSGLFLEAAGERFERPVVRSVLESSPADAAGIEPGDEIVAVDGEPVAGRSLDEVRALLKTDGATRDLGIVRGGETLTVGLTLRRLI